MNNLPEPFTYPTEPHIRKHGPFGYTDYTYYREWLRDEFSFRCVFCLQREQWPIKMRGGWELDHFLPKSTYPELTLDYENLLYTCRACNSAKSDKIVPNPCRVAFGKCLQVNEDGTITALNREGEMLIDNLRLDDEDYNKFRQFYIDALKSFVTNDMIYFIRWMSYPANLPNLKSIRPKPKGNSRLEGIENSHYEQWKRGELPEIY